MTDSNKNVVTKLVLVEENTGAVVTLVMRQNESVLIPPGLYRVSAASHEEAEEARVQHVCGNSEPTSAL
jgi:hypothetical protein